MRFGDVASEGTVSPIPLPDDFNIAGQVQGDVIYFNGVNWVRLAPGTADQSLRTKGAAANPAWENVDNATGLSIPSQTTGDILYYNGANWVRLAGGTSGDILTANGAGVAPTYQTPASPVATSGNEVFTSSGTFTVPAGVTKVYVSMVGGGGGAGRGDAGGNGGGGGGGASIVHSIYTVTPTSSYTVVVGSGGSGAVSENSSGTIGTQSSFDGVLIALPGFPGERTVGGVGGAVQSPLVTTGGFVMLHDVAGGDGASSVTGGSTLFGNPPSGTGASATANTGAGGNGNSTSAAGAGGSGIVIVIY